MTTLQPGQTATSELVEARVKLNPSGIGLEANGRYAFRTVDVDGWKDWFIPTDPDGFERWYLWPLRGRRRVPEGRWFQLAGQVGDDASTVFLIGSACDDFLSPASGELFLFANDAASAYGNNKGSLRVEVRRIG